GLAQRTNSVSSSNEAVGSAGHEARDQPRNPLYKHRLPRSLGELFQEERLPIPDSVDGPEGLLPGGLGQGRSGLGHGAELPAIVIHPPGHFIEATKGDESLRRHGAVIRSTVHGLRTHSPKAFECVVENAIPHFPFSSLNSRGHAWLRESSVRGAGGACLSPI